MPAWGIQQNRGGWRTQLWLQPLKVASRMSSIGVKACALEPDSLGPLASHVTLDN